MKILDVPARLRIYLDDSVTEEQIEKLFAEISRGDFPVVEASNCKELEIEVKDHVSVTHSLNRDLVKDVDLWGVPDKGYILHEL